MAEDFVGQLENLGFFTHVPPDALPELKQRIRSKGWDGLFYDESRLHRADAEDLAEGGVESLLREVESFLNRAGVRLDSVTSSFGADSYSIVVNGRAYVIWQSEDDRREKTQRGWTWGVAGARTLDLLNRLLQDAGTEERAYAVGGGNDLAVFFLTEPLQRAIVGHPDASLVETPYVPREEYPWFGQPH